MIVQFPTLNDDRFGRFGNQLFKFFFLKIIESELNIEIRFPHWLGNFIFDLEDSPPITHADDSLVILSEKEHSIEEILDSIKAKEKLGVHVLDLNGFFQFHTSEYRKYKSIFDSTFTINKSLFNHINNTLKAHEIHDHDFLSIHIRMGDYINHEFNNLFWTTPTEAIFNSLKIIRASNFKINNIYVSSDDLNYCLKLFNERLIPSFSSDNLFIYDNNVMRLCVDFIMMTSASLNIISNSSLSFFAAMLNSHSRIFLRPIYNHENLISFDPWNSNVLLEKSITV